MKKIKTIEDFNKFSQKFQQGNQMPYAFGIGLCFNDERNQPIAHKWLALSVNENLGTASVLMDSMGIEMEGNYPQYYKMSKFIALDIEKYFSPFEDDGKYHENIDVLKNYENYMFPSTEIVMIFYPASSIFKEKITSNADAHFRLAAMSRLKFKPNTICLDNLFSVMPNLIWGSDGDVNTPEKWNRSAWKHAPERITVDKIPLLTWGSPIPPEVRIANPDNVRLGAYLSPGTTIMHYGFVNFNAGTLGKSMVEGRISAGTTIDDGTDIGAGAGFLGTLSGGNSMKLSTGKRCLISANAECGVILGDDCVIATGTCFAQGTPILEIDPAIKEIDNPSRILRIGKVKDYNGRNNLTFWRNSITGALEVFSTANKHKLNEELHKN